MVLRVYLLLFFRSEIGIIFLLSSSQVCVYEIPAVYDNSAISIKTEAGHEKTYGDVNKTWHFGRSADLGTRQIC